MLLLEPNNTLHLQLMSTLGKRVKILYVLHFARTLHPEQVSRVNPLML